MMGMTCLVPASVACLKVWQSIFCLLCMAVHIKLNLSLFSLHVGVVFVFRTNQQSQVSLRSLKLSPAAVRTASHVSLEDNAAGISLSDQEVNLTDSSDLDGGAEPLHV